MCPLLRDGVGVDRILAHIHPQHSASAAVALHSGLRPTGALDEDGEQVFGPCGLTPAPTSEPQSRPMAYDEDLAQRIRDLLQAEPNLTERKMFGGLAFLVNGKMSVSASGQGGLLLHVDPADSDELLDRPHAELAVMQGRPMQGWLRVEPEGVRTDAELQQWVDGGVAYARSLPGRKPRSR